MTYKELNIIGKYTCDQMSKNICWTWGILGNEATR